MTDRPTVAAQRPGYFRLVFLEVPRASLAAPLKKHYIQVRRRVGAPQGHFLRAHAVITKEPRIISHPLKKQILSSPVVPKARSGIE